MLFSVRCKEHQWRLNMPSDDANLKSLDELMALAGANAEQLDLPGALEHLA